jgi:hypothetical protein
MILVPMYRASTMTGIFSDNAAATTKTIKKIANIRKIDLLSCEEETAREWSPTNATFSARIRPFGSVSTS